MDYPDFSLQGYQVIRELGRNREGGRIAWLASQLATGEQVVIKQFCFAQSGDWSAYNEHEREIEILKELHHPSIPEYLEAFETDNGFALVQEYKNAVNLAVKRSFDPEAIKKIAVKALEILVYLQNRIPPVIHRDIKPENILVDEDLNVYLIDFGISRIGSREVMASSIFKGTPGFIPPEQIRKPTEASDLYGLGATLICLLTGVKSIEIQEELTDDNDPYTIHFRHLLPRLSPRFLDWLESMVKPNQKERFVSAEEALKALEPLDIIRTPTIKLTPSRLKFQANHIGEKLQQEITIVNTMPETLLQGRWEVAPHLQDPPHTPNSHSWIVVKPAKFKGNSTELKIFVDTKKLMADKLYERQLLLHSNADTEVSSLQVQVKTAPLPIKKLEFSYLEFISLWLIFVGSTYGILTYSSQIFNNLVFTFILNAFDEIPDLMLYSSSIVMVMWIALGFIDIYEYWDYDDELFHKITKGFGILLMILVGIIYGFTNGIQSGISVAIFYAIVMIPIGAFLGMVLAMIFMFVGVISFLAGGLIGNCIKFLITIITRLKNIKLVLFTIGFGISSGFSLVYGISDYQILLALAGTGLPLTTILVYSPIKRQKLLIKYRKSESHLIKP